MSDAPTDSPRRALAWLAGTLLCGLVSTAALNACVDPYAAFGTPALPGLTRVKLDPEQGGGRVFHSIAVRQDDFDTLVLGSSRVRRGIDPNSPLLPGRVHKVGLPAANFFELDRIARYALEHRELHTLVIGLDFYAFSSRRMSLADFEASGFAGRSIASIYLRRLLSIDALWASLRTIAANLGGSAPPAPVHTTIHMSQSPYAHGARFEDALRAFVALPGTYADFAYSEERIAALESLIGLCADAGVKVRLYTSPVHAYQLEAIHALGLHDSLERWKRDLRAVADRAAESKPQLDLKLWDFSAYSSTSTEALPPDEARVEMFGHWEGSHYKAAVGDRVLAILFDMRDGSEPDDFGFRLGPGTRAAELDAHLERERAARERYAREQPGVVQAVEALTRATAPTRDVYKAAGR